MNAEDDANTDPDQDGTGLEDDDKSGEGSDRKGAGGAQGQLNPEPQPKAQAPPEDGKDGDEKELNDLDKIQKTEKNKVIDALTAKHEDEKRQTEAKVEKKREYDSKSGNTQSKPPGGEDDGGEKELSELEKKHAAEKQKSLEDLKSKQAEEKKEAMAKIEKKKQEENKPEAERKEANKNLGEKIVGFFQNIGKWITNTWDNITGKNKKEVKDAKPAANGAKPASKDAKPQVRMQNLQVRIQNLQVRMQNLQVRQSLTRKTNRKPLTYVYHIDIKPHAEHLPNQLLQSQPRKCTSSSLPAHSRVHILSITSMHCFDSLQRKSDVCEHKIHIRCSHRSSFSLSPFSLG